MHGVTVQKVQSILINLQLPFCNLPLITTNGLTVKKPIMP